MIPIFYKGYIAVGSHFDILLFRSFFVAAQL